MVKYVQHNCDITPIENRITYWRQFENSLFHSILLTSLYQSTYTPFITTWVKMKPTEL